ncbi:hypothetical protein C0995_014698 [Termitomyces sp. Mi166|nr:hypothetical protein C0995_014698 [Termitomyces sp. Mi166\
MARGAHASPPLLSLPKVSFTKIDDDVSTQPCGVHDGQARAFGYKEWLDVLNRERRKEQMSQISYELFEVVMDRLEKEWFDLTKNIPKPDLALPSEDSTCAICDDSEGENSNAIVFCDGCNLAVHQGAFVSMVYVLQDESLYLQTVMASRIFLKASGSAVNVQFHQKTRSLCPNEGGAFKQTVSGEWVHLLCAIWIPETRVANEVFMEPITGIDRISKPRWKLCSKPSCFLAFHATCARRDRLLMPMKAAHGAEPVMLACYCDKHLPKEQQDARAAAFSADEMLQDSPSHNAKLAKSARAYAKTYKPGPPLVPAIVVDRIDFYVRRFKVTKRTPTIQMMCRYWSLKREARRGAPLLKRLHLEPWTASAGGKLQTEEEKIMKLDQLNHLLYDLEGLKDLTFSTKKRERWKLEQIRAISNVLDNSFFVHERRLRDVLERIMNLDRQEYFKNPVSRAEVPDYFDIVDNPMCWVMIEAKLDKHEYWDMDAFKRDIDLVVDNAILYNKPGTPFHKAALRIQNAVPPILIEARQPDNPTNDNDADPANSLGDLEPSLELLELLLSPESIQDDMDLVLDDIPLASLFSFALPKLKPSPPPPPPPPKALKKRSRRSKKKPTDVVDDAALVVLADAAITGVEVADSSSPVVSTEVPVEEPCTTEPTEQRAGGTEEPLERPTEELVEETRASAVAVSTGPAKRERAPRQSRSKKEALPLVDDVNNHQSFTMFNEGWILPPEQKRGGRVSVDRQSAVVTPRPRKRMRTDAGPSRLSVVSMAATEAQPVPETPTALDAPAEALPPVPTSTSAPPPTEIPTETPVQEKTSLPTDAPTTEAPSESEIALQTQVESQELQAEQLRSLSAPQALPETEIVSQREAESEESEPQSVPLPSPAPGTPGATMINTTAEVSLSEESGLNAQVVIVPETGARSTGVQEPPEIRPSSPITHPVDVQEPPHPETAITSNDQDIPTVDLQEPQTSKSAIRFDNSDTPSDTPDIRSVDFQEPSETDHDLNLPPAPAPVLASQEPLTEDVSEGSEPPEAYEPDDADAEIEDDDDDAIEVDLAQDESSFVPLSVSRSRRRPSSPTIRRYSVSDAPPLSATETERVIEENGRKVLEMLDTPELRRKKAIEKRKQLEERKKQEQELVSQAASAPAGEGLSIRLDPEPSLLSEVGGSEATTTSVSVSAPRKRKRGHASTVQEVVVEPEHVLVKSGQVLDGGTIESFPWWPGVIWDENHPEIPLNIRAELAKAKRRFGSDVHIVQFFDRHRSWQILRNDSLRMLAEDKELDKDMIADKSKRQKTKWTPKNIQECRVSYQIAMQEMETVSDLENAAAVAANAAVAVPPAVVAEGEVEVEEEGKRTVAVG